MTDKAMVTDAMVEAAVAELLAHGEFGTTNEANRRNCEIGARAALAAALAQAEQPVAVKPLRWREEPVPPSGESLAPSVVGLYCIPHGGDRFYLRFRDSSTLGDFGTLERAKAAAQADYERRIMSCLRRTA